MPPRLDEAGAEREPQAEEVKEEEDGVSEVHGGLAGAADAVDAAAAAEARGARGAQGPGSGEGAEGGEQAEGAPTRGAGPTAGGGIDPGRAPGVPLGALQVAVRLQGEGVRCDELGRGHREEPARGPERLFLELEQGVGAGEAALARAGARDGVRAEADVLGLREGVPETVRGDQQAAGALGAAGAEAARDVGADDGAYGRQGWVEGEVGGEAPQESERALRREGGADAGRGAQSWLSGPWGRT